MTDKMYFRLIYRKSLEICLLFILYTILEQSTSPVPEGATAALPGTIDTQPPAPEERAASWLAQHVPPTQERNAYYAIQELRRDDIIQDISELLHHQIVTETLEGPFRQTLESLESVGSL